MGGDVSRPRHGSHGASRPRLAAPLLGEQRIGESVVPLPVAVEGVLHGVRLAAHPDPLHQPPGRLVVDEAVGDDAREAQAVERELLEIAIDEPGDSIEITGLTAEALELQTPAKGATTLSIPESRAVTVAIETSGDGKIAEVDVPGAAGAVGATSVKSR